MELHYNTGGAWNYNIYNPTGNAVASPYNYHQPDNFPNSAPSPFHQTAQTQGVDASPVLSDVYLKVFSPTNKKDFVMYTLRNFSTVDISTPGCLKEIVFKQVGETVVSSKLNFPVGYYQKSSKLWINNDQDVQDALALLKRSGRLTFWCVGLGKSDRSRHGSDCDSDVEDRNENVQIPTKKRKLSSMSEERTSRVSELKAELRQKHGSKYSSVQYALWSEMIVGGTHENMDEPPLVPMFGAQRPRGRASAGNLTEVITDVADKIVSVLSPVATPTRKSSGNCSSPSKSVELRGKYIQQLKDLVNLRDIGALTEEEYEEQRSELVSLMRRLSSK